MHTLLCPYKHFEYNFKNCSLLKDYSLTFVAFLLGSILEYNYLVMLQYPLRVAFVPYEAVICFVTQYR